MLAPNFRACAKARPASSRPETLGRKAQIVLDAGTGAGLAAKAARIQHDHRQPLRGRVNCRCEACRACADHRYVVNRPNLRAANQTQRARQVGLARIAQDVSVGANRKRQILRLRGIAREHVCGKLVGGGVQHQTRKGNARKKALQSNGVSRRCRADQHDAACLVLDQIETTHDQRPHDLLAEAGLRDQHCPQSAWRNHQSFDVADRGAVDERGNPGEFRHLGQKLTGPLLDHRRDLAQPVVLFDGDMTRKNDDHPGTGLAGLE